MAKEDLLTRQIAQLGFVLRTMLEKLVGSKSGNDFEEKLQEVQVKMKEELNFDLDTIAAVPDEDIIPCLQKHQNFTPENIEILADVLIAADAKIFSQKAFRMYSFVNQETATYSIERNRKMEKIRSSQNP